MIYPGISSALTECSWDELQRQENGRMDGWMDFWHDIFAILFVLFVMKL